MENLLRQAGACAVGCVAAQRLRQHMSEEAWARAEQTTPGLKRLLCAAFPYGPEHPTPGKLSLYARGADYHHVLAAGRIYDDNIYCRITECTGFGNGGI